MMESPELKRLNESAKKLVCLLDDAHPGLHTWNIALRDRLKDLQRIASEVLDHGYSLKDR